MGSIDLLNDLADDDTYFDELDVFACDKGDNDIQIAIVLRDGYTTSVVCYLRHDGIKVQIIQNDKKFAECMSQTGYARIGTKAMQIEGIDLKFAHFRAFIEKDRNFAAVNSVDIAHNLFFNFLDIKRWTTSDGLRWFLKALLRKHSLYSSSNVDETVIDSN